MLKNHISAAIIAVLFSVMAFSYAQGVSERLLVLRQARESRQTSVGIEAYLVDDILEVTVTARMYATKPRIFSVILVGPKLGRISAKERKTLLSAAADREEPFPTDKRGGFISFSQKTKTKTLQGTLTRELHKIKLPTDKIIPNRRYQLWVKAKGMQEEGRIQTFKFNLENLADLISANNPVVID